VITIQSILLVLLGLLIASLVVLLWAPAYRARVARLTADRVRSTLPLTEAEVRADRDRIRADNAIRIHKLQVLLEQARLSGARQSIELNRRDGVVNALQSQLELTNGEIEEARNARHVLEQTIADRVPRVEQRLTDAKKLLEQRDRDITALTSEATKTMRALDEALQINTQQRQDLERTNTVLSTRAAQNRDGLSDPRFDAEVALTSEIEALRARTRDQGALISRLQALEAGVGGSPLAGNVTPIGAASYNGGNGGLNGGLNSGQNLGKPAAPEVERLQREIATLELQLNQNRAVGGNVIVGSNERSQLDAELSARSQRIEDQTIEIAQLKGTLAAYQSDDPATERSVSLRDSKIALKARLGSLQSQTDAQVETIRKLRAELAASNERMARQAQHFMDEMRRLGAGTLPTSAPASSADRRQLAQGPAAKRSLSARISEPKAEAVTAFSVVQSGAGDAAAPIDGAGGREKVTSFMKALGVSAANPAVTPPSQSTGSLLTSPTSARATVDNPEPSADAPTPVPEFHLTVDAPTAPSTPPARPRLLERLGAPPKS
jgi:chromosome segregation ATPase